LRYTDIGEELGFDEKRSEELADYLAEEGLIKYAAMGVIEVTRRARRVGRRAPGGALRSQLARRPAQRG
jgi:Mn-dependent DtxR family transcriptional regulator